MNCCFCEEIGNPYNFFNNNIGYKYGLTSRIISETEHWIAVPTIGCLTVGHILLVAKKHYACLATIPEGYYSELLYLQSLFTNISIDKLNKPCIFFEHGVISSELKGTNCVDHVHLHMIPYAGKKWGEIISNYTRKFIVINTDYELLKYLHNSMLDSYLYYRDFDNINYLIEDAKYFPSQFFRMIFAKEFNIQNQWDWRSYPLEKNMLDTIDLFKESTRPFSTNI